MTIAFCDFETRSPVDLAKSGVEVYAEHPATDVLCLCWAFDDGPALSVFGDELRARHEVINFSPTGTRDGLQNLFDHVAQGGLVVAHNARFEITLWEMMARRHGWPSLKAEQVHCTMAMARALSLPGGLGDVAHALKLNIEKDAEGRRLMLKMCKPCKGEPENALLWNEDPADLARLIEYCKTDVAVERLIYNTLPKLSPAAQALWVLDQKINDRGVYIDLPAVRDLLELSDREIERLNGELKAATCGAVKTVGQGAALNRWLTANGCPLPDAKKATIANALKKEWTGETVYNALYAAQGGRYECVDALHKRDVWAPKGANVRRVLQIRQEANKAGTKKLKPMIIGSCADSRARGLLEYHGAGTGRWAGRRVQPQNMVRTPDEFDVDAAENVFAWARVPRGELGLAAEYESAMSAVSWSMRSLICAAPGNTLISADYSNIEGRVLAWLAGEQWKTDFFTDYDLQIAAGEKPADNYMVAYSKSFGVPIAEVTKKQRQIGKVQELALGYQGGHGAFLSMGANYNIDLEEIARAVRDAVPDYEWREAVAKYWNGTAERAEEMLADLRAQNLMPYEDGDGSEEFLQAATLHAARSSKFGLDADAWAAIRIIVDGWRQAHQATREFWYALDRAAIEAVKEPGRITTVGRISYRMGGNFLYCRLPSGRPLAYPFARVVRVDNPFGEGKVSKIEFEGTNSKTKKWETQRLYGGLLAENVTQATACDVLADALRRLEPHGYPTTLHVHDEIVAEVLASDSSKTLEQFSAIMAAKEPWAEGLPVAVAGWRGNRYRK